MIYITSKNKGKIPENNINPKQSFILSDKLGELFQVVGQVFFALFRSQITFFIEISWLESLDLDSWSPHELNFAVLAYLNEMVLGLVSTEKSWADHSSDLFFQWWRDLGWVGWDRKPVVGIFQWSWYSEVVLWNCEQYSIGFDYFLSGLLDWTWELAILTDQIWIEVWEVADVDDFDFEVWIFQLYGSSQQPCVGGGFLEGSWEGDNFIDHEMMS